jgi:phytoene desaturase
MSHSKKAVIIGSGIAGLASAIRLAVQGMQVTVFEKNSYPGGKLSALEINGYHFDAGPSVFTQPANIEELFALAGEPIENYFSYERYPVSCNYVYDDGTGVAAFADKNLFEEELVTRLGEKEGTLIAYLQKSERIYRDIGEVFLEHSLHKRNTFFKARIFKALRAVRWPYLFGTLHKLNAAHFRNPKTVQLFDRFATYNGSNPYKAPGMLSLISHLEHNEGTYYPKGGMISITNALYALALKKGVIFHFDTPVQRIIRHEGKVMGVVANEQNIAADMVVSNMDVYFTYKHLMHDENKAHKILKQERSSSALVFYWGIKKEFPALGLHNIFFTNDYKAEFDHIFRKKKMYDDPTIYVNVTAKCEPGLQAPQGKENWFVMVNAPANVGQDWQAYREKYRKIIIDKLSRQLQIPIESFIEAEAVLDPVLIETNTASFRGSLYGTSSNSKMAAFLRHPNFSKSVKGLYFVGGSVHPGGGIPLCLHSAKIMSQMVQQNAGKTNKHS